MPITQSDEIDDRVVRFVADLLCKLVSGKVSVPQAVQAVNKFADSLKGTVPEDQWADAYAHMMDYVLSAQETMLSHRDNRCSENTMQRRQPAEEASDDRVTSLLRTMRKALLKGSISMAQAMGFADQFVDEAEKAGLPEDRRYRLKAHLSEFLLSCQAEKEQKGTQRQHDNSPKIRWLTDPAELGLKHQEWTPPSQGDYVDRLWESIKAQLPPHMIDTPEKCDATARHIGFLIGFWGERGATESCGGWVSSLDGLARTWSMDGALVQVLKKGIINEEFYANKENNMIEKKSDDCERLLEIDNLHSADCGSPPSLERCGKVRRLFRERLWRAVGLRR